MATENGNFELSRRKLQKPKIVFDIQPSRKSVYGALPKMVNLSFRERKSFPYLEMFKAAVVLGVVAVLILGHTVAPTTPALAVDAVSEAKRAELETQLKDLESQIAEAQAQAVAYQKQGNSLKGELGKLNAKIASLTLEVKAGEYAIKQLDFQMADNQTKINQTKQNMATATDNLALILRRIYETDRTNVISILLRSQKLSDFFNDVNDLTSLQDGLRMSINQITDLKANLEDTQQLLALSKADKKELQAYKQQQQVENDQTKTEKNQLLTVTKGQESKYQELVKNKKEEAAQIRNRIFRLLGGGELPFGDALKIAKVAEGAIGVRAALILAVLTQESSVDSIIGRDLGRCYYNTPWDNPSGTVMSNTQKPYFLAILAELGATFDPNKTPVSCPISSDGDYGGAMGPAQFMPQTWSGYKGRVGQVTGGKPASPFNNLDAFTATALYLKDGLTGCRASFSTIFQQENCAAAKYYAGSGWRSYMSVGRYGYRVADRARGFEADIATLNQ